MITNFEKFKLLENVNGVSKELLTDFLDDNYISDYFDDNYLSTYNSYDIIELIELNPNIINGVFNEDKYFDDIIEQELNNNEMSNYDDVDDYINYLKEHMTEDAETKIMNLYYVDNDEDMIIKTEYDGKVSIDDRTITITEDGTSEEYEIPDNFNIDVEDGDEVSSDDIIAMSTDAEYDSTMLDELDINQLRDIISEEFDERDFLKFTLKQKYDDKSFLEEMGDMYSIYNYDDLIHGDDSIFTPKSFYDRFSKYIDDNKLVGNHKKNEDTDYKYSWVEGEIDSSTEIQKYLLDNASDPYNKLALLLYDLFEDKDDHSNDISDDYDFQKRYIEQYVADNGYDDNTEEENGELIATALENINDNFILDSQIKNENKKNMFKVDANKFNM